MQSKYFTILMLLFALLLCSCATKTDQTGGYTIVDEPQTGVVNTEIHQLNNLRNEETITLSGSSFRSLVTRQPDSLLSVVTLEEGERYRDNRVHLTLTDASGRKVLDRDFTKASFQDLVSSDFYDHSILEGVLLEKVEDGEVYYVFGISDPESDDYAPMHVIVNASGNLRIEKANLMDGLEDILFPAQANDSID